MTKEQDYRCQQILFGYEDLILKAIKNKQKALNVSSKEYKKWDKIEKDTRRVALSFLNRYSSMFSI